MQIDFYPDFLAHSVSSKKIVVFRKIKTFVFVFAETDEPDLR